MKDFNFYDALCNSRGPLKEMMMLRRIRRVDINNYLNWKGYIDNTFPVRSVKIDLLNNYLYLYDRDNKKIDNETSNSLYPQVYDMVMEIFRNEKLIPLKKRKNIVVKVNR